MPHFTKKGITGTGTGYGRERQERGECSKVQTNHGAFGTLPVGLL